MRIIHLVFFCILFQSCNETKENSDQTIVDITDTTFLKTIHWDSLNTFVDYRIFQQSNSMPDSNLGIILKPIAIYRHVNQKFERFPNDTIIKLNTKELKDLILSDSFSNKSSFDCLFKINSKIFYKIKPTLLQTVFVRPKDMSSRNINKLMTDLKKEKFAQDVTSEIQANTILDTLTHNDSSTTFIKIKLQSDYWGLKKIKDICSKLNQRKDVSDAFFIDFYEGPNEMDTIYRLTIKMESR